MSKSYLPQKDSELLSWLQNFKSKINTHATMLGLSTAQVADIEAWCDNMNDAILLVTNKRDEFKSAVNAKDMALQTELGGIRQTVANIKTLTSYTQSIGADLDIISVKVGVDMINYKAAISTEVTGGTVRIKFKKKGADGVNIYRRPKGSPDWTFLSRATKSPFQNKITLAVANQPEHWEYMAYGVMDDDQFGQPSDIVEIVFGG